MRIVELYSDYHIDHVTEGHKHVRDGWVNVACPFCTGDNPGYHLGYSVDDNYFSCWRCGGHYAPKVISALLSINMHRAKEIIQQYGGISKVNKPEPKIRVGTNKFMVPFGTMPLQRNHKLYLKKRNFDWEYLDEEWGLLGTGPMAKLDDINYSNRILAPIHWENRVVSFQTRDITNRHPIKYLACPQDRERIQHQHILYGNPLKWGKRGVCVEGITDVWRLGPQAFAVFGISYTHLQVLEISRAFDEVVILFDPEKQAQKQAKQLQLDLEGKKVKAWIEVLDSDPGDMSPDDAIHLMLQLL